MESVFFFNFFVVGQLEYINANFSEIQANTMLIFSWINAIKVILESGVLEDLMGGHNCPLVISYDLGKEFVKNVFSFLNCIQNSNTALVEDLHRLTEELIS